MINEVVLQLARCSSINVQVYQPPTLKKRKSIKYGGLGGTQMLFFLL